MPTVVCFVLFTYVTHKRRMPPFIKLSVNMNTMSCCFSAGYTYVVMEHSREKSAYHNFQSATSHGLNTGVEPRCVVRTTFIVKSFDYNFQVSMTYNVLVNEGAISLKQCLKIILSANNL